MQETLGYLHQLQCRRDKRGDADGVAAETDAPGESVEALELRGGAGDAPQVALHPMLHEQGHVTWVQLHHGDGELDSVTTDPRDGHARASVLSQDVQQRLHQCLLRHTCHCQARPQLSGLHEPEHLHGEAEEDIEDLGLLDHDGTQHLSKMAMNRGH